MYYMYGMCVYIGMWRLEDNLQELILAFYHVGSKD